MSYRPVPDRCWGLTLIELLVVVVVVAILAALAMPFYGEYVTRSQRSDAQTGLSNAAQRLERCYTANGRYDHGDCPTDDHDSPNGYYEIRIETVAADYFELLAAPQSGRVVNDTRCGEYTLDSIGRKTVSGSEDLESCW